MFKPRCDHSIKKECNILGNPILRSLRSLLKYVALLSIFHSCWGSDPYVITNLGSKKGQREENHAYLLLKDCVFVRSKFYPIKLWGYLILGNSKTFTIVSCKINFFTEWKWKEWTLDSSCLSFSSAIVKGLVFIMVYKGRIVCPLWAVDFQLVKITGE